MTTEVLSENMNRKFPFENELIPIVNGIDGFQEFIKRYPNFIFCPYLADKTAEEWGVSTSRRYMNQVLPEFLYVPVNITAGNDTELATFIQNANVDPNIAAVNITKPHKSTPVLREYFFGNRDSKENVDTLIKGTDEKLHPFDLNAPAFVNWFEDEVTSFADRRVIIVGVGGVGEPVAKHIDGRSASQIDLVDVKERSDLSTNLTIPSDYYSTLQEIQGIDDGTIIINASGKDGISDDTGLLDFLRNNPKGIFVDLRPHLEIEIVEKAKELGWNAHTGHGMNARNDYELLSGIMDFLQIEEVSRPSFEEFSAKVAAAS